MNYGKYFAESDESDQEMEDDADLGISRRDKRAAKREQAKWDQLHESEEESDEEEEGEAESEESSEEEEVKQPVVVRTGRRGRPPKNAVKP